MRKGAKGQLKRVKQTEGGKEGGEKEGSSSFARLLLPFARSFAGRGYSLGRS